MKVRFPARQATDGISVVKRKHYSAEQMVAVLKQAELGMAVSNVLRQVKISKQTQYRYGLPSSVNFCGV